MLLVQVTCGEAVELLQEKQIDQVPILTDVGYVHSSFHTTLLAYCQIQSINISTYNHNSHTLLWRMTIHNLSAVRSWEW